MSDQARLLYVTQHEGEDCGVVRYGLNRESGEAEISIMLEELFHGRHIGRTVIGSTSSSILEHEAVDVVVARVRPDNAPSVKAFEEAGYMKGGREAIRGVAMVRLELTGS